MVNITHISMQVAGDVGGVGISRFWFQRADAADPTQSDCNSAAAAVRALLQSAVTYIAADTTYTCQTQCELQAHDTGAVSGLVTISSVPAVVTGGGGGNYAAGTGYRLNWKTLSVHNRRFIRGCNFITPIASGGWTSGGIAASAAVTAINTAIGTYLAAMSSAALDPIIWHRPPTGTFTGGAVGLIVTGAVSTTPASLRSRRT
jgi:hypothetical protein